MLSRRPAKLNEFSMTEWGEQAAFNTLPNALKVINFPLSRTVPPNGLRTKRGHFKAASPIQKWRKSQQVDTESVYFHALPYLKKRVRPQRHSGE
jgi:hypothetical protein